MLLKKTYFPLFIFLSLALAVFWLKAYIFLDPDFGWHLKLGELILREGIPKTDPFSYTMPGFPFIDHEWLTNVFFALLYSAIGFGGLAVLSASLVLGSVLVFISKRVEQLTSSFVFVILTLGALLPFAGIRPRVITWFLFALLLKLLFNPVLWKKWRAAVPLLFVLWVNLHGAFAAGLAALLLVVFLQMWEKGAFNAADAIVAVTSLLASLINPYGYRIWGEVLMQFSDTSLRWSIIDWFPGVFVLDVTFIPFIALSFGFVLWYRKKIPLPELGLFFVLFAAGMSSQRHLPLWFLATIHTGIKSLGYFLNETSKNKVSRRRSYVLLFALTFIAFITFLIQSVIYLQKTQKWREGSYYPKAAVEYLKRNPTEDQLFSRYSWGGYLIWKLPGKRVFIDGRMPSWRIKNPQAQESENAFEDYDTVLKGDFEEIFRKYTVTTVLWPKPEKGGKVPLLKKLIEVGWTKMYEDDVSVVYRKAL